MSAHPETPHAPQEAPTGAIGVDIQAVLDAYASELAQVTQRAIMAEAGMRAAQAQLAEAQETIHALSPGAPTTQEN